MEYATSQGIRMMKKKLKKFEAFNKKWKKKNDFLQNIYFFCWPQQHLNISPTPNELKRKLSNLYTFCISAELLTPLHQLKRK